MRMNWEIISGSLKISDSIDKTKISAKYDNGQLIVHLPKSEKTKPRTIDIS